MKKTKLLAVLGTVCALSVTASVGTAVYAYYVRHQLNQQNTLTIGNAEMFITNEEGTTAAAFSADITPYNGQFAPETYAQAVELARQDNGTRIADAKIIVSREEESRIFYGLSLETADYANSGLLAQNVYVTCYEVDETSAGTLTEWNHVPLADAGYIEGNMGADSTTYHIFVTYENVAGAGTGDVQFDIALNSSPAPVTANYDIKSGEEVTITGLGRAATATLNAQAWFGGNGSYTITQNGAQLLTAQGNVESGWQPITIGGVAIDENGSATLGLTSDSGTLFLKDVSARKLADAVFVDASTARTNRLPNNEEPANVGSVDGTVAKDFRPGDKLYFDFMAQGSGKANLEFRLASGFVTQTSDSNWGAVTEMGSMPLDELVKIKFNGVEVNLDGIMLEGGTSADGASVWHLWNDISFTDMDVNEGLNTFEVEFIRHEQYIDAVPEWIIAEDPEWGAKFGANVDGLKVIPADEGITSVTACTAAVNLAAITAGSVSADSVQLSAESGKLMLTFDLTNNYTLSLGGYAEDVDKALFNDMVCAAIEGTAKFDHEKYEGNVITEPGLTVTPKAENTFAVAADLSAMTELGRYGLHFYEGVQSGDGKNFTPAGEAFTREAVIFGANSYVMSFNPQAVGSTENFWNCVGITVSENVAGTLNAAKVSVNGAVDDQLFVWLDNEGTITMLAADKYTVSGDKVTYNNNTSVTCDVKTLEYTYAITSTGNTDNILLELAEREGAPYLVLSVNYTVTKADGALAEIDARADELIADAVFAASHLGTYKAFNLEGNPNPAGAVTGKDDVWKRAVEVSAAEGAASLFTRIDGENKFEFAVDLSAVKELADNDTQTHFTMHMGETGTENWLPANDIYTTAQIGTKTYVITAAKTVGEDDGAHYWGCVGIIALDEIAIAKIEIANAPDKTEYVLNDPFVADGLEVTAYFNDGTFRALTAEEYTTDFDSSVAGVKTVTVTSTANASATATFEVTVTDPEAEATLSATIEKSVYRIGEQLEGLEVTLNIGEVPTVLEAGEYQVSSFDNTSIGEKTITVTYMHNEKELTASVNVTVMLGEVFLDANNAYYSGGVISSESSDANGGAHANGFAPDNTLSFAFVSDGEGKADITFRLASSFIIAGSSWSDITEMGDIPLADLADITLNDAPVDLTGIILEGGDGTGAHSIWTMWRDITFAGLDVKAGLNVFEVTFKEHPQYDSAAEGDGPKVPSFTGAGWGTTFCANVDGVKVLPQTTAITFVTEVVAGYTVTDTAAADDITINIENRNEVPTLVLGVDYTVTLPEGVELSEEDMSALNEIAGRMLIAEKYSKYTMFDAEGNGAWDGNWNEGRHCKITAEGISLFKQVEGEARIEFAVDLSGLAGLSQTHYTVHFGPNKGDGTPADYKPGVAVNESITLENGTQYAITSVADVNTQDGQQFWGCIGIIITKPAA